MEGNEGTKAGTVGGTLLTVITNINKDDIFKTIVLAVIGAVVSFCVSYLLKKLFLYFKSFRS